MAVDSQKRHYGAFTNCTNVQSAAKKLSKSEDRELVDDAAIAFIKCFIKRYFDSPEDTATQKQPLPWLHLR